MPDNVTDPKQPGSSSNKSADERKNDSQNKDIGRVMLFFYWSISIALLLTSIGAAKGGISAGITAVLWATGGLAVGTFAGFLFGIPKILQRGSAGAEPSPAKSPSPAAPNAEQSYRQQVNTNLTEISDWLTKIIVGLGLIHLKQAPAFVMGKATVLAASLKALDSTGDYLAFATAILVTFPAFGFLFGYLSTRLYLASAFARADLAALNSAQTAADANSGRLESLTETVAVLNAKVNQTAGTPSLLPVVSGAGPAVTTVAPTPPPQMPPVPATDKPADPQADLKARILSLSKTYGEFDSANKSERVLFRNQISEQLAVLINNDRSIRDWVVAEAAKAANDDGLVAGLATAINAEPEPGDVARLMRVAKMARYKHSRYKVATAIGRLFDSRLASLADAADALSLMAAYSQGDTDDLLSRRIRQTIAQIHLSTGMNAPNALA